MNAKIIKLKNGQISVEASIIVPMVFVIVVSMMYMALYTHDIISIRSGAYTWAMEKKENKEKMPGLFVIRPKVVKTTLENRVKVNTSITGKSQINFIKKMIYSRDEEELTVQRKMNTQMIYAERALLDMIEEGGN